MLLFVLTNNLYIYGHIHVQKKDRQTDRQEGRVRQFCICYMAGCPGSESETLLRFVLNLMSTRRLNLC